MFFPSGLNLGGPHTCRAAPAHSPSQELLLYFQHGHFSYWRSVRSCEVSQLALPSPHPPSTWTQLLLSTLPQGGLTIPTSPEITSAYTTANVVSADLLLSRPHFLPCTRPGSRCKAVGRAGAWQACYTHTLLGPPLGHSSRYLRDGAKGSVLFRKAPWKEQPGARCSARH